MGPPEDDPDNKWGISLVDGSMIEVPRPSKQYGDQSSLYIEDPGIRKVKGTHDNVARSLKTGTWRTTLDKCREAARVLKEDGDGAQAWLSSLVLRARAKEGPHPPQVLQARPKHGTRPPQAPLPVGAFVGAHPFGQKRQMLQQTPKMPPPKRLKQGVCRWFQQGECWDGDACPRAH